MDKLADLAQRMLAKREAALGSPLIRKNGQVVGVMVAGNGRSYALSSLRLRQMLASA